MKVQLRLLLRIAVIALAVAFVARNILVIVHYGAVTLQRHESRTELPQWTNARVVSQLNALQKRGPNETIVSTAENEVVARFEGASLIGRPLLFVAPYMGPFQLGADSNIGGAWAIPLGNAAFRTALKKRIEASNIPFQRFVLFESESVDGTAYSDRFFLDPRLQQAVLAPNRTLLLRSFNPTLLNNWKHPGEYSGRVLLQRYEDVHDVLVYVPSARGSSASMLFRFEDDVFDHEKSMEGIGRYLLFQLVNPSKRFRVELNYTSTSLGDGKNIIPPASLLGKHAVRFPVVGHGAARLFSPPVEPQLIGGIPFVSLDMGRDGRLFPEHRRGVMALFGAQFRFDRRKVVGFMRDISIVPDNEYRSLRAPHALFQFPRGLEDPNLEFSGIYEDGWIADRSVLWLSAPRRRSVMLTLRAMVPMEAAQVSVQIDLAMDGHSVASTLPAPGELTLQAPVDGDGRRHEIKIMASPTFGLLGSDGRPASIHLEWIGFE